MFTAMMTFYLSSIKQEADFKKLIQSKCGNKEFLYFVKENDNILIYCVENNNITKITWTSSQH